jgi:hypothetical protein
VQSEESGSVACLPFRFSCISTTDLYSVAISATILTHIYGELVDVFGHDAYSIVTKYLRNPSFEAKGLGWDEGPVDPATNFTDDQNFHAFEISFFASVCQIARMTLFPKTTVYRHVRKWLNFLKKTFHRVSDSLSEEQKRMRIENQINCSKF